MCIIYYYHHYNHFIMLSYIIVRRKYRFWTSANSGNPDYLPIPPPQYPLRKRSILPFIPHPPTFIFLITVFIHHIDDILYILSRRQFIVIFTKFLPWYQHIADILYIYIIPYCRHPPLNYYLGITTSSYHV